VFAQQSDPHMLQCEPLLRSALVSRINISSRLLKNSFSTASVKCGHLHDVSGTAAYHPGAEVGRREVGLPPTDPSELITVASKPRSCKSRRLRAIATTDADLKSRIVEVQVTLVAGPGFETNRARPWDPAAVWGAEPNQSARTCTNTIWTGADTLSRLSF
jgi:hypothetical protein